MLTEQESKVLPWNLQEFFRTGRLSVASEFTLILLSVRSLTNFATYLPSLTVSLCVASTKMDSGLALQCRSADVFPIHTKTINSISHWRAPHAVTPRRLHTGNCSGTHVYCILRDFLIWAGCPARAEHTRKTDRGCKSGERCRSGTAQNDGGAAKRTAGNRRQSSAWPWRSGTGSSTEPIRRYGARGALPGWNRAV